MWGALAQLKFLGNVIVVLGDVDGQFLPIEDQDRHKLLKNLDRSPFMHDLVNGLHVTLRKYRQGTDSAHFPRHRNVTNVTRYGLTALRM